MPIDPALFGPATLAVTQGIGAFVTFLPKFSDIRIANPTNDPAFAADVRMGEVAASVLTLGVGAIVSSLTGSPIPAISALVMTFILIAMYETTLRANRPLEAKTQRVEVTR